MAKIITFGELMLRLQPYNYERFVQCDHVEFTFGGGEANVAVSLANYGMDVAYVTKLPAHAIGQGAVDALRAFGVDTSIKIIEGTPSDYDFYEDVDIYKLPTKANRTYYKTFNMCEVAGSFTSSGWQGTDKGTNYIYGKANAYELRDNPTVTSTYTWSTPIPARTYVYNLNVTGQENGYYNNPTVTITYENGNTEVVFSTAISTNSWIIVISVFLSRYV